VQRVEDFGWGLEADEGRATSANNAAVKAFCFDIQNLPSIHAVKLGLAAENGTAERSKNLDVL
jgi:hypothetical protein